MRADACARGIKTRQLPPTDPCGASRAEVGGTQAGDPQGSLPLAHLVALLLSQIILT